ncbi:hypothetical protein FBY36_2138 [Arthrobacter sp. SLBN-122]|nr:hypothetical protein FBY36_2138 [Arthrobacter sp. SLBN-122]
MVPNRIRLSAVGRSRRLIVEARGFRGSAPVSVFYFTRPKSILTAGVGSVPENAVRQGCRRYGKEAQLSKQAGPAKQVGRPEQAARAKKNSSKEAQSSSPSRHALAACSRSSAVLTN